MTETPERGNDPVTGATDALPLSSPQVVAQDRPNRLYQVAAWVAIVAGTLFIVATVFFTGFFLGRHSGGGCHHHGGGGQSQHHRPPMVPMWPGPGMPMGPGMGPGMGSGGPGGAGGPGASPSSAPARP